MRLRAGLNRIIDIDKAVLQAELLRQMGALIQAVTILGEHPAPLEVVGGGIILIGVRVATLRFKPETPLEEAAPA